MARPAESSPGPAASGNGESEPLRQRLIGVRSRSEALIEGLEPEDLCLQGMADASPAKWHLGHTGWFFETFLLEPHLPAWEPADRRWGFLFNSYYDAVGARHPRPQRGLLTRPPIAAVLAWRQRIDRGLHDLHDQLKNLSPAEAAPLLALIELGLQHEQQHQELLLMDLLDGFSRNPLEPAYRQGPGSPESLYEQACGQGNPVNWLSHPGGLVEIGQAPGAFHFDNEAPRHREWLEPFAIADRLVTNADYASFIADGGYRRPDLWMSEGWAVAQARGWESPRYWRGEEEFTLAGRQPRQARAPVRHLSWFEADAFARWAGARLPSEAEWETAAATGSLTEVFGLLWQWTGSPYRPYPGFSPAPGAVGEYNGKFMTSQFVLRGSCFLTPAGHARLTYRNFFPPASRWMAAGLRLARTLP